jgi:hypothetical protein
MRVFEVLAVNPPRRNMSWSTCQAVSNQGRPGAIAQARPVAIEPAADAGTAQAGRAPVGAADDSRPLQAKHAAGETLGVQGWLGGVFDLASGQGDGSQVGIPGENAFFQEAVAQFKVDIRGEVFQVKPAGDPGTPKPQPMRLRVGCEPPTQDVPDHSCPAGPRSAPRLHRGLANRLITGGQVEPFPSADMIDQRLLHRGQSLIGHLSDHTRTLDTQAPRFPRPPWTGPSRPWRMIARRSFVAFMST